MLISQKKKCMDLYIKISNNINLWSYLEHKEEWNLMDSGASRDGVDTGCC
jgi:hypothetical protein